ncbi:MAG: hypothetical protein AB7Q29_10535 [Vicinamibacterales bacterium]
MRTTFVRVADVSAAVGDPIHVPPRAGEVRILGQPANLAAASARVREVLAAAGSVPVSAYSLDHLEALASQADLPLRTVLEDLQQAGLELIAEAPFDRLRDHRLAIEEVNIAGLSLARLTIHTQPQADIPGMYRRIAALQHEVGVLRVFAPLPRALNPAAPSTGYDDVRTVALARLLVPNVASIQVDWALYGPKLAQVALTVGADDIDSVSPVDDEAEGRRRTAIEEVRRNVTAAGQEPVERDGRFDMLPR